MTEKNSNNPNGWTFETLYLHVMEISKASKEAINAAMAAAKEATLKAEAASEKRFDSVNEFRNAMKDQQTTFANRETTEIRLQALERVSSTKDGKSQSIVTIALVIAWVVTTGIALAALLIKR